MFDYLRKAQTKFFAGAINEGRLPRDRPTDFTIAVDSQRFATIKEAG